MLVQQAYCMASNAGGANEGDDRHEAHAPMAEEPGQWGTPATS